MAGKKVDLRKQSTEQLRVASVDLPGLRGTLPFAADRAVGSPADLPEKVRAEEEWYRAKSYDVPEEELLKAKAMQPPPLVDIEDLPEEKQKEVLDNVQKAIAGAHAPQKPQFIPRGPGIAEAKAFAERVAAETEAKQAVKQQPQKQQPQKPASRVQATMRRATQGGSGTAPPQKQTQAPPPPPPPQPEPEVTAPSETGATDMAVTTCVHCGYPVGNKDCCNPTVVDKQMFVASVLGQRRFLKEYAVFDGKVEIVFRTLTVEETDLIMKQLMADWNAGRVSGPAHSVSLATQYQMALAVHSVSNAVGDTILPTLEDYTCDAPAEGTILPTIVDYVTKQAMPNEHVRRIISKAYAHFVETTSRLEAMAENPSFWQATEE